MSSHNSGGSFFTGLITGGLLGAGLALLLAPQSGEETRGQIRDKSFALKDEAMEGLTETGHRVQAQAETWQEKGHEVSEAISQSKDSIVRAVSQGKDRVVQAAGSSK